MSAENIKSVLHTGISVYNMEESVNWYRRNLGFEVCKDDGYTEPLQAHVLFMEKDGYQLELFEYNEPNPLPQDRLLPDTDLQTVGTKHIAFAVDDMNALKDGFLANGVEIVQEVRMGNDAVMFIHDCNGVLIEFIQTNVPE